MNDIKKLLGQRIKELRKAQKISQLELAERAHIDQRSLSHVECGNTFPSKALLELSNALNVELEELFMFEHHKKSSEEMKFYICKNLECLSDENIKILYRFIKSMK